MLKTEAILFSFSFSGFDGKSAKSLAIRSKEKDILSKLNAITSSDYPLEIQFTGQDKNGDMTGYTGLVAPRVE